MGSRNVTRKQLQRGAKSQREQLESYYVIRKVMGRAESLGHVLGDVRPAVGPRGGTTYECACSCGHQVDGKRSAWAAYNDAVGHLGEVLGERDRTRVGKALTLQRRSA